jgi:para-nitrobenzyl esterase
MATVTTRLGEIKGSDLDGCERYAGIRYAEAPIGAGRFLPPVPIEAWDGVYDATAFGPSAPQPPPVPGVVGVQRDLVTDEDCLFLNVYTPKADGSARPVMVWIHGGAYTIGSGDIYDGTSFVRRGDVVVVTLNYRLGVLGWTPLDHLDPSLAGSGNNGVRDQIEALRWVRDNIAAFGGDPENVTIFGESAGGGSVAAVLCAPEADGLYHKAIIQSGAPGFGALVDPAAYVNAILAAMGEPDGGIEALRSAAPEALVQAQVAVGLIDRLGRSPAHPIDGSGDGPHPIVDGVVVTRTFVEALREKGANNVPLIIGTNREEGTLFGMLLPQGVTDDQLVTSIGPSAADPSAILEAVRAAATGRPPLVDLMTDAVFRIPSLKGADEQAAAGAPVWVYLFAWRTPVFGGMLGATHALEIPFVWDMLEDPTWSFLVGEDPPRPLAEAMQDAWLSFARTGRPAGGSLPEWPEYDPESRPTLEFGNEVRIVHDPGRELREAWYRSVT